MKIKYKKKESGESWCFTTRLPATALWMLAKAVKSVGPAWPLLFPIAVMNRLPVFALILKASAPMWICKEASWWARDAELSKAGSVLYKPAWCSPEGTYLLYKIVQKPDFYSAVRTCCHFFLKAVCYVATRRHSWHGCCSVSSGKMYRRVRPTENDPLGSILGRK